MKIAIASEGNMVSNHFGYCEGFTVYEVEDNRVAEKQFIENPGHRPGFLPVFLKEKDVKVVISGAMGALAQQLFNENRIEIIVGASGKCDDIIKKYLTGQLKSTGSVCEEHSHEGHCN